MPTPPPSGAPLPAPRGPLTDRLFDRLRGPVRELAVPAGAVAAELPGLPGAEAAGEDELHLALYCLYELHYRGFPDVDPDWEWEPSVLALRRRLERRFESHLRALAGDPAAVAPGRVVDELWAMATGGDGPSLSKWVAGQATVDHVRELFEHRSAYQLKEADPHTWAIPRLAGPAKAVMATIQYDEYGAGRADAMHSALFARTMADVGLDPTPNRYLDDLPGWTLATTNLMSLFGLHRRWRGALVGHLALFEMTSTGPTARYSDALRRLGFGPAARRFFDVHVVADEEHQYLATDGMVAGLMGDEPALAGDVLFGARCLTAVECRFTAEVLGAWQAGRSSLRLTPAEQAA